MGLTYTAQAAAAIAALAPGPKRALRRALESLRRDGVGAGDLDVRRLRGFPDDLLLYRLRVGDYRVVYVLDGKMIRVVRVFHRRDGYGWMERSGV